MGKDMSYLAVSFAKILCDDISLTYEQIISQEFIKNYGSDT